MEPVYLPNVDKLLFQDGERTAYRRTRSYPRLELVGGSARRKVGRAERPKSIMCHNVGQDERSQPVWQCKGRVPSGTELGRTSVICEGWSAPGDLWVTPDSCQLQYDLELVDKMRFRERYSDDYVEYDSGFSDTARSVFFFIAALLAARLIFKLLRRVIRSARHHGRRFIPRPANVAPETDSETESDSDEPVVSARLPRRSRGNASYASGLIDGLRFGRPRFGFGCVGPTRVHHVHHHVGDRCEPRVRRRRSHTPPSHEETESVTFAKTQTR